MAKYVKILSLIAVGAVSVISADAHASSLGIAGCTGKPNPVDTMGASCTKCHANSNPAPTLALTGPDSIQAGATVTYTLTVNTTRVPRCMVAASLETVNVTATSANVQNINNSEIYHKQMPTPSGTCTFTVRPTAAGSFTLYYAGAATNAGISNPVLSALGYARATKIITVTGGTPPGPDSGVPPITDSGVPPRTDSGTTPPVTVDGGGVVTPLSDGGSIITYPDGAVASGPAQTPRGSNLTPSDDQGGCNTSGSPLSLSGIFAAGAVATFLLGSRRLARRRRS